MHGHIDINIILLLDTQYIHLCVLLVWSVHSLIISLSSYSLSKCSSDRAHISSSSHAECSKSFVVIIHSYDYGYDYSYD